MGPRSGGSSRGGGGGGGGEKDTWEPRPDIFLWSANEGRGDASTTSAKRFFCPLPLQLSCTESCSLSLFFAFWVPFPPTLFGRRMYISQRRNRDRRMGARASGDDLRGAAAVGQVIFRGREAWRPHSVSQSRPPLPRSDSFCIPLDLLPHFFVAKRHFPLRSV